MFNIYRVLLLDLKKVEMVKLTYSQIPNTQYNKKPQGNLLFLSLGEVLPMEGKENFAHRPC